ncbi:hypothetical protein HBH64_158210 [Parastagonospora nodorum]|nr:hypothetical protein HBH46_022830 [Parastagonospora nodorum]KAH4163066.1 hypothetical protein HBH43_160240 [Parastagonospora nodorum]KAH4311749.1 hypothetical protein HBI01_020380 [Parastagonospora nodorum]KAH4316861.1 hypothetical protein HBI02_036720 [Parastagonospora nodorum]KAH4326711.1 hypothetical protein HBI00_140620 [Parastagonospora nodorum]
MATATDQITVSNTANSPLLRLPAELRNEIFAYVASQGTCEIPRERSPGGYRSRPIPAPDRKLYGRPFRLGLLPDWFGLLHACKQTYNEAAPLPTQLNTFTAHEKAGFELLFECLSRLRSPTESLRLRVEVNLTRSIEPPYVDLGRKLPTLKTLELMVVERSIDFPSPNFHGSYSLQFVDHRGSDIDRDAARLWLTDGGRSSRDVVFL